MKKMKELDYPWFRLHFSKKINHIKEKPIFKIFMLQIKLIYRKLNTSIRNQVWIFMTGKFLAVFRQLYISYINKKASSA
jgi:hypothetical protein